MPFRKRNNVPTKLRTALQNVTTIHGTRYFTIKSGAELKFWTFIMIINGILSIGFVFIIKQRYYSDQIYTKANFDHEPHDYVSMRLSLSTVVGMEKIDSTCKVGDLPFPAVSICNFNMLSRRESKRITRLLQENRIKQEEIESFYRELPKLSDYEAINDNISQFDGIMKVLDHHYYTVDTVLEEMHQKCEDLLIYCAFDGKELECKDIFVKVKTVVGYCCTFNYGALNDGSGEGTIPKDFDLKYYDDDITDDKRPVTAMIATSRFGRLSGLSVIFNLEPNDYADWTPLEYYGAKVLITDPNDYPETSVKYKYVSLSQSLDIKVTPFMYSSEPTLRRLSPQKRDCWFHDEVLLSHTSRYSYETCRTECKMKVYVIQCGCLPYKYPRDLNTRICDLKDLECLHNVTVNGLTTQRCDPPCFVECKDKRYNIASDIMPFSTEGFPVFATQGRNQSELSSLRVYYSKNTCNCYKLSLLFDLDYFIGTYGGVFSLTFGGSVLTFIEISLLLLHCLFRSIFKSFLL